MRRVTLSWFALAQVAQVAHAQSPLCIASHCPKQLARCAIDGPCRSGMACLAEKCAPQCTVSNITSCDPDQCMLLSNGTACGPSPKCTLRCFDLNTAVHDLISVGMVRKTMLNITETVTDVEWSEKKIWHRYRTNMVSGPPCCCILGYGAETSVEEIGPNKTLLINRAHQETKWCSPLLCFPCPCCCMCWNAIGNSFLVKDVDELEKKWAAQSAQAALL